MRDTAAVSTTSAISVNKTGVDASKNKASAVKRDATALPSSIFEDEQEAAVTTSSAIQNKTKAVKSKDTNANKEDSIFADETKAEASTNEDIVEYCSDTYEDKTDIEFDGNNNPEDISNDIDSVHEKLSEVEDKQGLLGKFWNGIKTVTGIGLSNDGVKEMVKKYENGAISKEEALECIENFDEKQNVAKNLISTFVSTIATAGVNFFAGGLAPVSSLCTGALTGALSRTAVKTVDRATNNIAGDEVNAKAIAKDFVDGAIDGAFTVELLKTPTSTDAISAVANVGCAQGACFGLAKGIAQYASDCAFGETTFNDHEFSESIVNNMAFGTMATIGLGAGVKFLSSKSSLLASSALFAGNAASDIFDENCM